MLAFDQLMLLTWSIYDLTYSDQAFPYANGVPSARRGKRRHLSPLLKALTYTYSTNIHMLRLSQACAGAIVHTQQHIEAESETGGRCDLELRDTAKVRCNP